MQKVWNRYGNLAFCLCMECVGHKYTCKLNMSGQKLKPFSYVRNMYGKGFTFFLWSTCMAIHLSHSHMYGKNMSAGGSFNTINLWLTSAESTCMLAL